LNCTTITSSNWRFIQHAQVTTEIDALGRVRIAPEFLSVLHLLPGTTLLSELKDGRIVLEPLPEEPELIEEDGLLLVNSRFIGITKDWVQEDRDARIAHLSKDFE